MTHLERAINAPPGHARSSLTGGMDLHEVAIEENEKLARNTYRVRFQCPELARKILPGQFVMLRLADRDDPLLARPLAMYDTVLDHTGAPIGIDLVYLVVGKMTGLLSQSIPGTRMTVLGPLGNNFSIAPVDHLILVAGGIGQTPLLSLGKTFTGSRGYGNPTLKVKSAKRVSLCYGVQTAEMSAGISDFEKAEIDVHISSNDGTIGYHGMTTDLLETLLSARSLEDHPHSQIRIACCGPKPMMQRVAQIAGHASARSNRTKANRTTPNRTKTREAIPCEVSLETPMACGIGACFSCVVRVQQADGSQDYQRACVEGPIFDASKIVW